MTPSATATLSHRFTAGLDAQRHQLWNLALASLPNDPAQIPQAESRLQSAIREAFAAVENDPALDPYAAVQQTLQQHAPTPAVPSDLPPAAMPADVWARLVATIQVQAAKSAHSSAINPDSVLLAPDPLLAPKRLPITDDAEGFDLSPHSRFLLAGALALLIGITLTAYVLTRPGNRTASTLPSSTPATKAAP